MVFRDYEVLTLHEVRRPSMPAYICQPEYHYTAAERVFRMSFQHRRASLGYLHERTMASLNNWITTLIKLKRYGKAAEACREMLDILRGQDQSPYFIITKCNLAACLFLSKHKKESGRILDYLRKRHMLVQFNNAAEAYFEALSMTCRSGRDCMVLRESEDSVPGIVRIYDYENTFFTRQSKTGNSRKIQQFLRSLHRTASLLLRSSRIHRLVPITVSLEPDVPHELDARLDSFMASTSSAGRKSPVALADAFQCETDQHATEQQVAKNYNTIVRPETPRPHEAQAARRPPVTHCRPESQAFRAYSCLPFDEEVLESGISQAAPKPQGIGMGASGPSHTSSRVRMEAKLKRRDNPIFVPRPEQRNKQHVSSTTGSSPQKPQAADGNLVVETWLECQKANPPIPDMFPMCGPPSSPADPMIGLTYRTNDTIGSSQVADMKPENLLPVTAWAGCSSVQLHNPKQIRVLLDDGASENCVSEEFCEAISGRIDTGKAADLKRPDGKRLQVIGRVKVAFSWEGPSGTKIKKIPCYVVKELEMAMLICHAYILKLELRGSPAIQATFLSSRTKQEKLEDEKKSKDIAAAAELREE